MNAPALRIAMTAVLSWVLWANGMEGARGWPDRCLAEPAKWCAVASAPTQAACLKNAAARAADEARAFRAGADDNKADPLVLRAATEPSANGVKLTLEWRHPKAHARFEAALKQYWNAQARHPQTAIEWTGPGPGSGTETIFLECWPNDVNLREFTERR